ncbi:MAG: hypothetical protein EBZ77_14070 [Chitinophagia bacterium]|nr:hypothetical protein [Chitinophagia bacterium]
MKHTHFFFALAVIATLFAGKAAHAQEPAKYYEVLGYLKGQGYTVTEHQYCNLEQGEICTMYHTCSADLKYVAFAFTADDDVKDIDLYIYDSYGNLYKKDAATDQSAAIGFVPSYTQNMKFSFKNYRSNTPAYASKVYLILAYKE